MTEVARPVTVSQRKIMQARANKKESARKHVALLLKLRCQLELTGAGGGLEAERLKVNRGNRT